MVHDEQTLAMNAGIACVRERQRPMMNVSSRASNPVILIRLSAISTEMGFDYKTDYIPVIQPWTTMDELMSALSNFSQSWTCLDGFEHEAVIL